MAMSASISQVTTLPTPFEVDLPAFARAGFAVVELWLTKLETYLQSHPVAEAKALLADNGLTAGAAASQGGLLLSGGAERREHLAHYQRRLDLLGELGVGTLIVVPDFPGIPTAEDYRRATDALGEVAAMAAPHGVKLALEFNKSSRFCASLDTTLALIAQAGAANVGVCLDLFHYYAGPSKLEDLDDLAADRLAWVQVCDLSGTPRELAGDADRILPGEGDFRLGPILGKLEALGYDGPVSLELMNPMLWSVPVDHLADAAMRSMARLLHGGRR